MERSIITSVGIDVSKYKSTIAAKRPGGEVALVPFDVVHDAGGIRTLVDKLRALDGDIRVVMEHTGMYLESNHICITTSWFLRQYC